MCGISGFWNTVGGIDASAAEVEVRAMANALTPRGPDDDGVWVDGDAGVALSHRRLSIVDLSPMGHQPMLSASGDFVLIYNGEIYNHAELRAELEGLGVRFRGGSDTEVIVEACDRWGVLETVKRLIGMFAFALWHRRERTLTLVRDRVGIKPLYWGVFGNTLLFGSELKALKAHPAFRAEIDRDAIASFLRYNYVPAPLSIFKGVHKLVQGTMATFGARGEPRVEVYWSLHDVVRKGLAARARPLSDAQAEDELDALLRDAVKRRMVADVPLGAFLSGGIDSSTVVALMQAQSDRPIRTFSIGFHESGYDEAVHAKAVAAHLGTDHTELYVPSSAALDVIPRLPEIYDEPFADSSQIPTYLVSALARKHVTVALSGDGGDELFGGYERYLVARSLGPAMNLLPGFVARAAGAAVQSLSADGWNRVFARLPARLQRPRAGEKLHKLAKALEGGPDQLYQSLVSHWAGPQPLVIGCADAPSSARGKTLAQGMDAVETMQYLDALTYLPDDILTKVDRASMAVSLEARVPLLDHRVVEFAWSLPGRFRIRGGTTKWLLRKVLDRYVPRRLIERPKMGFGIPLHAWLRGPMRGWAEDLLDEARLTREGYLNPAPIRRKWDEHLSGAHNWHEPLWGVLMFQAWLERQR